jgi:phospholipid/cholesterol/gamma-HCH transport system substrate-binding protein
VTGVQTCALPICPTGVPVIPAKRTGLGALLNSAPQLLERLATLSERLTELLNDKNQKSFSGILENTEKLSATLARNGPQLEATLAETRQTIRQAGLAAEQLTLLTGSANTMFNEDGRPAIADLRKTVARAQQSMEKLDAVLEDARPGLQAFSTQTIPEIGQLVRDLRVMSESLGSVATKLDQGGAGALIGAPALPDYKPGRQGQ